MRNNRRIASNRIRQGYHANDYHSDIKGFDLGGVSVAFIFDFRSKLIRHARFGEESFNCSLAET